MDHASLGESVDHGGHSGQLLRSLVLILDGTDVAQSVAHGFGIVAVSQSLTLVCSNSLNG